MDWETVADRFKPCRRQYFFYLPTLQGCCQWLYCFGL